MHRLAIECLENQRLWIKACGVLNKKGQITESATADFHNICARADLKREIAHGINASTRGSRSTTDAGALSSGRYCATRPLAGVRALTPATID
jgi:hypothetical protein